MRIGLIWLWRLPASAMEESIWITANMISMRCVRE